MQRLKTSGALVQEERIVHHYHKRSEYFRLGDVAEDSIELSEIQKVLSPYWASRTEFQTQAFR